MNRYDAIADLYDEYVADTRDLTFWRHYASTSAGAILELTAGTGRATVALHDDARPIVCLDLSIAMPRRLVSRFVESRNPPYPVCAGFALVVIPFNSLGEVVDPALRQVALTEVGRVLAAGGRAIVSLHNPRQRRSTLDGVERLLGSYVVGDRTLEVGVRGLPTGEAARSEQTYRVIDSAGRVVEERRATIEFALPDERWLEVSAARGGLEVTELFGGYDRSPFDPETSPFILAVLGHRAARRPPAGPSVPRLPSSR